MSAGEEEAAGLFGGLPEQAAPRREVSGLPRLRTPERRQVELRAVSLEELLPAEHRARFVWAFAGRLDLSALYGAIKSVDGRPGHPAADPRLLLALWLYATVEGVGSARELDRLCCEHVGFQWMCGGVSLNHVTLAEFRVAHAAVLERLLIDGFAAMLQTGQATLQRVAQDGMRVRAAAGAASFRRLGSLARCREAAAARLAELHAELEADPGALSRRQAAQRERAARQRQLRVEEAVAVLDKLGQAKGKPPRDQAPSTAGEDGGGPAKKQPAAPRASTSDAEARVMKMADGGFRPAFNVGFATDTRSGMVAAVAVDNRGSDMGKLATMSDQLAIAYGRRPAAHLVDGGFVVSPTSSVSPARAWPSSPRRPLRAPRRATGTPRSRTTVPASPPGGCAWAAMRPRPSTRSAPRRRNGSTANAAIAACCAFSSAASGRRMPSPSCMRSLTT